MDAKAFLDLAEELCGKSGDEAALRTSVSRSYYALHNYFGDFIETHVFELPKGGKRHDLVYKCLHNCQIPDIVSVAKDLDNLHEERNRADYELRLTEFQNPNLAVLTFKRARIAYSSFQKFMSNASNRKKTVNAIKEYRKKAPF